MAANKWSKWVVGMSSVLTFTGFLYVTQKGNLDSGVSGAVEPEMKGWSHLDGVAEENYQVNGSLDSNVEIFLFEAEKIEQMMKWPHEKKSDREELLEALSWEVDPHAEITIPAQTDRFEQGLPRSHLKTRGS